MKKKIIIIFLILSNILVWFLYYLKLQENNELKNENKKLQSKIELLTPEDIFSDWERNTNCKTNETYYDIVWESMQPLIKNLAKVKVIENYYKCKSVVERGDIIIYETSATPGPIIKQVRALPNDIIKFDEIWKLYINWELLKNSVWQEYIFDEKQQSAINMYVREWKLQETSFLAFWDNVSNSDDSRRLWWLGLEYFKAKVILE